MRLRIVKALGLVTVQDLGRRGRMHEGLPHGGALVRELLINANRLVANPDGAAAIEVLGRITIRTERDPAASEAAGARAILAATPDRTHPLAVGDELTIESEPRRASYLAVRGGIDAPLVLGGRATHLSAGIGATLRAGDVLDTSNAPLVTTVRTTGTGATHGSAGAGGPPKRARGDAIRVIPGPDLHDLSTLVSAPYQILPTSDRVGTRLAGPVLEGMAIDGSRPMCRGAIEVPPDGQPIVLGPEHPTTGGYPLIGVIAAADLDRFFAIRLGDIVRFAV